MTKRQPKRTMTKRAVVEAAVIFQPRRVCRVLMQVLSRHLVVLTADHAAQAREERLRLVRAHAIIHERNRMVDALRRVPSVQPIPR